MNPATGSTESGSARARYSDTDRGGSKIVRKQDCGFEMDFSPTTLEEQFYRGGWDRNQVPEGGSPDRAMTSGMNGEPNLDDDTNSRVGRPMSYRDTYSPYKGDRGV